MEHLFKQAISLRWADLDPNAHVRHSVYYDWGASIRVAFLSAHGVTFEWMEANRIGPILFREEAIFRREIRYGDDLQINLLVSKARRDGSRFSFRHEIARADGTLCAVLNVDGAWLDTERRKLAVPPDLVRNLMESGPKSDDFEWI